MSAARVTGAAGALDSVRELERALESKKLAAVDADARVQAARAQSAAVLATARERAAQQAGERRRALLAEAEAKTDAIGERAEADALALRARARELEDAAVEAGVALVLPSRPAEAT